MFKLIILGLTTTFLFSSWLSEENIKNYPTVFGLTPLKIENNLTVGESGGIYKGTIQEYSQDGTLWFKGAKKELWHQNYYPKPQLYKTDNLYKLESKTPLFNSFRKKLDLNQRSYLYKQDENEEFVYILNKPLEFSFKEEARVTIEHRLIMNHSTSSNENYTIEVLLDGKSITKELTATLDTTSVKTVGLEENFLSTQKSFSFYVPKEVSSLTVKFSKDLIGNIYYQKDIDSVVFTEKDLEELHLPKKSHQSKQIDNRFENSSFVNHQEIFKREKDFYYYQKLWNRAYEEGVKQTPYRALLPKELPRNSSFKSGYFFGKSLVQEERENRINPKLEREYLTKVNSGTFISTKGFVEDLKKENKHLIKELQFELDDAKTSPEYLKALKIVALKFSQGKYKNLEIVSHTDKRGSAEYNLALSKKRADAVALALATLGVEKEKIIVTPKGESQLKSFKDTEYAHQLNRRVEVYGVQEKTSVANSLLYQLPPRENHWLRVSMEKIPKSEIEMFVDGKLYGTLKIQESNLKTQKTVTEEMLEKYSLNKPPFIWYKTPKDLLSTGSIELFIEKAETITFKSTSKEIPPIYLEIRDSKDYFFDEDRVLELFSLPLKQRQNIVEQGLFKENEFSNGLFPLKEFLDSRSAVFEKAIDKTTPYKTTDLDLVEDLITNGELGSAVRISKFFMYKKKSQRASEYLKRLYSHYTLDEDLLTLKSYETNLYQNLNNSPFLLESFYKNSNFQLALLASLSAPISFKTYKIAEKLKLFRVAEFLKPQIKEQEFSENIWRNISHKITAAEGIARVKNQRIGKTFTRFLATEKRKATLKVYGPTTLKIESRGLTDESRQSYDGWLNITINGSKYITPTFSSIESENLVLENIQGGVGGSKVDYITLPKGVFEISINGNETPTLLGIWEKKRDFQNRFTNHIGDWQKDTIFRLNTKAKRDSLLLIDLLHKYEESANEFYAVAGGNICLKYKDRLEFSKICERIEKDLTWRSSENFLSNAGIVRSKESFTVTNNAGVALKKNLLDRKNPHTLLPTETKLTYKILKRAAYSNIRVERVSYNYYKQENDMNVVVEVNGKKYEFFLKKGQGHSLKVPLTKEINRVTFIINSKDIGTFANIIVDGKAPTFTKRYYLSTPTYPIKFIGEYGGLYRVNFDDGEVKYFYINSTEYRKRVITLDVDKEKKAQIFRLKQREFTPFKKKLESKETLIKKSRLELQSTKLFEERPYLNAKVKQERCLDYYSLFYRERKASSEDVRNSEREEFLQLSKDLSCKHNEDLFSGFTIFARQHLNHQEPSVFGVGGKFQYRINGALRVDGALSGKFQDSSEKIFTQELSTTYRALKSQKSILSFKLGGFNRVVEEQVGSEYIDKDIFTTYKKEHKNGLKLSSFLSYNPYEDTRISLSLSGISNEDLSGDNISASLSARGLFNSFEGEIKLSSKEYLKDDLRESSFTQETLLIDLKAYDWFSKKRRGEIFSKFEFDLTEKENYFQFGVKLYFNGDSFYENSYPATEHFKSIKTLKDWNESNEH